MDWEEKTASDVTSAFVGITAPVRELIDEIHRRGWTVNKVKIKDHSFQAVAKSPHGETLEAVGQTDATAVGNLLSKVMRREYIRRNSFRVAAWDTSFVGQLQAIAEAYSEAPTYDPKAASAWIELAHDCQSRGQVLQAQVQVEVVDDPNPYKTADEMREDVREKQHIFVTRAYAHHPVWSEDQVIAYRLVSDILGHCVGGGDWGWHGENQAFSALAPLLTPEAQKALFTESLGQTAYQNVYRQFGPQKIAFLDDLIEKAQEKENKPGHSPTHPSQSLAPAAVPDLDAEAASKKEAASNGELPHTADTRSDNLTDSEATADPNQGWESGVDPLPDNAFLWQREPSTGGDPLDAGNGREMAYQIDPGLADLPPSMSNQAVANAFRAPLLAPRKSAMHNAQHYQHIANIPADISDPMVYWHTLEEQRRQQNVNLGLPEPGLPFAQALSGFRRWVKTMNPRAPDGEVHQQAERELMHMLQEEEERILAEDPQESLATNQVEMQAYQNLQKRIKAITKPRSDDKFDFGNQSLHREAATGPYGSYLASHIRPVADVSKHIDDLNAAAHDDLRRGGTGHTFRAAALGLGIPGVTPKVASQAWLNLHPHGSQLAVLDPHVMETLGHDYGSDLNDRDYFKYERELATGRDASGYGHIPLGQFSWGMRDYKMGGPGFHQDLSPTRVLNPTPWEQVDWPARDVSDAGWSKPYWWESTQPARNAIGEDWDRMIAVNHPSGSVPFQHAAGALSEPYPYFTHPTSGEEIVGAPGASLMQHIKESLGLGTVHDVWGLGELPAGKR